MGNSSSLPQDPRLSETSRAAEFRLSPCQIGRTFPAIQDSESNGLHKQLKAQIPPKPKEKANDITESLQSQQIQPQPTQDRVKRASPSLDVNNIPLLYPGEESDPEHSPVLSMASESRFETLNPSRTVRVIHTSPSLSHRGFVANDEFEFTPVSKTRSRSSHITQKSISAQSIRSWSSMSARSRSPDRQDRPDPVDAGVPPRVPPHRILSGKLVSTSAKQPIDDQDMEETFALPTGDASALPVRVYTRKCSIHHASSPELENRLSRQSWPSLTQDSETDETSSMLSEEQEITRFILDGYSPGSPLKVVNDDDFGQPRKFFVKSKAMLAEEAERKLQRPITAAYGYI